MQQVRGALASGVLTVPESAPFAWTAHADLAEVAAIALAEADTGGLEGLSPALTGSELTDIAGVTRMASEVTGKPVRLEVLGDEDFRAAKSAQGLPETAVEIVLDMFVASRRGDFAPTDPTLERTIGHPATLLRQVVGAELP